MDLMQRRRLLMMDALREYQVTGNPAVFSTNVAKPLRGLSIPFLPVQTGSGDPSPSNVRPITGWDGVTVYRTGKNLFDKDDMTRVDYYTYGNNGTRQSSSGSGYFDEYISVQPSTSYVVSGEIRVAPYYYNADKGWISRIDASDSPLTFTTPANCYFIRLQYRISDLNVNTVQLEQGSTATAYEPYSGSTYPVAFPADPGTIYGGYVDLAQGVVTVTHTVVDFTQWNSLAYGAGNGSVWYFNTSYTPNLKPCEPSVVPNAYCDKMLVSNYGSFSSNNDKDMNIAIDNNGRVRFRYNSISGNDHKNEMYQVLYGITLIAELNEPYTIPLSSFSIPTTLKGTNAIWTDTNGTNTVTYLKRG